MSAHYMHELSDCIFGAEWFWFIRIINTCEEFSKCGEVPKRLKGLPWKGSRSLIAARGFKSLLLRLLFERLKDGICYRIQSDMLQSDIWQMIIVTTITMKLHRKIIFLNNKKVVDMRRIT